MTENDMTGTKFCPEKWYFNLNDINPRKEDKTNTMLLLYIVVKTLY